jgi:hypothetical protein
LLWRKLARIGNFTRHASFDHCGYAGGYMKKIHNQTKPHRSFRRYVKKLFASFTRRQNCHCSQEIQKTIEILLDVKESVEIIAREIARQLQADE